jgi:hypothetical protein
VRTYVRGDDKPETVAPAGRRGFRTSSTGLSSIVKITLRCKLLKTRGEIVWLGVRDDFRNWLIREAA